MSMIERIERVFETEVFATLKHHPILTVALLVLLATLVIAVLRVPT